jgi:membrane protein implicated in regulation of membrane protease activity
MLFVLALVAALLWLPSPLDWILVGLAVVVDVGETVFLVHWSKRRRATVGVETLVGRRAVVVRACRPVGQVRIDGELWRARCEAGADEGEEVEVRAVETLTLLVEPYPHRA